MIKITFQKGIQPTEIMGLKDGDVIDVSSGQIRLVPPEQIKTKPCGCTIIDGCREIFLCKAGIALSKASRESYVQFQIYPSIVNEDLYNEAMMKFRNHLNK